MVHSAFRCPRAVLICAILFVGWAGCVHDVVLKPDATASSDPGQRDTAFSVVEGVRVFVAGGAWNRHGSQAIDNFTPVQIAIENHSGRALRIAYANFLLEGGTGARYFALAPAGESDKSIDRFRSLMGSAAYQPIAVYVPMGGNRPNQERLVDAPYRSYSYAGPTVGRDAFVYASQAPDTSWPEGLPTAEMLAATLPAGPVENNQRAAGFVYFQGVGNRESRVNFEMILVDASNGQPFGRVSIPFTVSK